MSDNVRPQTQAAEHVRSRRLYLAIALALFLATFLLYVPSLSNDFLQYDDPQYVTANRVVQQGLNWQTVKWAFTTNTFGNWLPVTWLSHLLDVELFGLNPTGHHATSAALHAVNAALVFLALAALTGARWRAAGAAVLFAVHPLRTESVCWIAERKDVLCGTFFLLMLLAYAAYCRRPSATRYAVVLAMLALGLMSKTMLVTAPFLLLLLDFWPLRRLTLRPKPPLAPGADAGVPQPGSGAEGSAEPFPRPGLARVVLEKIPMLALVVISCVWTVVFQAQLGAMWAGRHLTLEQRVGNALVSIPRYLGLTAWPVDLTIFYPHPGQWPVWQVAASAVLILTISAAAIALHRRNGYLAVGWLWFLGMLVPVLGIVQVGLASMAERYTYLPGTGLAVAVVWAVADALARYPHWRRPLVPLAAAAVVVLAVGTVRRQTHWSSTRTVFERALAVDSDNWLAHSMVGMACDSAGQDAAALEHFRRAIELNPAHPDAYYDYGHKLHRLGRVDEGIEWYRKSLQIQPQLSIARFGLGVALASKQQFSEAVREFEAVAEIDPRNPHVRLAWGVALLSLGKNEEAAARLWESLRLDPHNEQAKALFLRATARPSGAASAAAPAGEIGQ